MITSIIQLPRFTVITFEFEQWNYLKTQRSCMLNRMELLVRFSNFTLVNIRCTCYTVSSKTVIELLNLSPKIKNRIEKFISSEVFGFWYEEWNIFIKTSYQYYKNELINLWLVPTLKRSLLFGWSENITDAL